MIDPSIMLTSRGLSYFIQEKNILDNINLVLYKGEILTLIGPNGSGKTTLIRILLGLIPKYHGYLYKKPDSVIGYMPQKMELPRLLPMDVHRFLHTTLSKKSYTEDFFRKIIDMLHMTPLLSSSIHELSGGEFQRLLLGRALLQKPDILIMDEPLQGVDIAGQHLFYHYIDQLRSEEKMSILMVSHDLHTVMRRTDHVLCLNKHICCEGPPHVIKDDLSFTSLFGKSWGDTVSLYIHSHNHTHTLQGDIVQKDASVL